MLEIRKKDFNINFESYIVVNGQQTILFVAAGLSRSLFWAYLSEACCNSLSKADALSV